MALSRIQKQVLDQFNVSQDLQSWMAQEFDAEGQPKGVGAPDFLMVLSDHLQAAEVYLDTQRRKLNRLQNPAQEKKVSPEEWQVMIASSEAGVKEAWLRATAFWQILDQVMMAPKEYGVILTRRHIEYAFQKKNLPLIEILRWAKPEYFEFSVPPFILKLPVGLLAMVGGIFSGFWGKMTRGKREAVKRFFFLRPFLLLGYLVEAFLMGTLRGAVTAGRFGFRTGRLLPAIRLGYYAAWYNPFNDPIGSKNQQVVELKTLESYFQLSAAQH